MVVISVGLFDRSLVTTEPLTVQFLNATERHFSISEYFYLYLCIIQQHFLESPSMILLLCFCPWLSIQQSQCSSEWIETNSKQRHYRCRHVSSITLNLNLCVYYQPQDLRVCKYFIRPIGDFSYQIFILICKSAETIMWWLMLYLRNWFPNKTNIFCVISYSTNGQYFSNPGRGTAVFV